MRVNTRLFGEIEIDDSRIITFTTGIMGFEEYKRYSLVYNSDNNGNIKWLQCLDNPELAFAVVDPMKVIAEYNPVVDEDTLAKLGEVESEEDYFLLAIVTVPSDLTKMTANLKAPVIINIRTCRADQIIVNNDDYEVRYKVYDYIKKKKEDA